METVVAVVGIMLTRVVNVPRGTAEEIQQAITRELVDPSTGDYKMETFTASEASIKLAIVEEAPTLRRFGPTAARIVAMLPLCTVFALERLAVL